MKGERGLLAAAKSAEERSDEDPALPLQHGELMASVVPGARLVVLEGIGHELPPGVCVEAVAELLSHFRVTEAQE